MELSQCRKPFSGKHSVITYFVLGHIYINNEVQQTLFLLTNL